MPYFSSEGYILWLKNSSQLSCGGGCMLLLQSFKTKPLVTPM